MRIRVSHTTSYRFDEAVRGISQVLRLTPLDHEGQQVVSWRVSPSRDGRLRHAEDAFGNALLRFETDAQIDELTISVEGIVETFETAGVVRGSLERVPLEAYLRLTPLTQPDEALIADAEALAAEGGSTLELLHRMLSALTRTMAVTQETTHPPAPADKIYAERTGSPRDLAHVFLAMAKHLEIPARIVTGYLAKDNEEQAQAIHAWVEAYVAGLGWVGFDVATGLCAAQTHVRLACGLDYNDVSPIRGARKGGGNENMTVALRIMGDQ